MPDLQSLPPETLNHIAELLPSAKDIIALAKTCHTTKNAIYDTHASCWRRRFCSLYDLPTAKSVAIIREVFVQRDLLRFRLIFKLGDGRAIRGLFTNDEERALKLMRDLIVESYSGGKPTSNNIRALRHLTISTNICTVNNYWARGLGRPIRLLQAVHLMLLVPQLEQALENVSSTTPDDQFPISQKAIYAHPDVAGLFADDKYMTVNLDLLGHLSNFFKFHVACYEQVSLFEVFDALGKGERPSMWDSQIMQGPTKLKRHWKGTFAALPANHVQLLRELRDPSNLCLPDEFYENNALMDLELDFGPVKMLDGNWPRAWDDALQSIPPMRLIKALKRWPRDWIKTQPDPNKFTNKLTTEYAKETYESDPCHMEEYEWRKWIQIYNPPRTNPEAWSTLRNEFKEKWENMTPPVTPTTMIRFKKRPARLQSAEVGKDYYHFTGKGTVPPGEKYQIRGNLHAVAPVEDIPGWQRISFMQSRVLPNGQEAHECCEGVVLPGNKIILGRVWALGDGAERYSIGPFIFWNVEQ